MTPYPIEADDALDALVEAARIMVDNDRQGTMCYYRGAVHYVGENPKCALCQLHNALAPYTDS